MNKFKGLILDLGSSSLLAPSEFKVDEYISKIESGEIKPPQYIDTDNKLLTDKIPSEEDWIETVKKTGKFFGGMTLEELKPIQANDSQNLNTYLQNLVDGGTSFNENTNWLVFNDNGTEKLVSKKPLKYDIAWNSLYNAGVVFGQKGIDDLINTDFTHYNYDYSPPLKDKGKGTGELKTYKPTYITINNKKYIVRLMRAYNENISINEDHNWRYEDKNYINAIKGSEWNRLILPLIDPTGDDDNVGYNNGTNGRYGSITKDFVESNMPTLANYSWWTDFGGNNNSSGKYDKGKNAGMPRWIQETGYDGVHKRTIRGSYLAYYGASYVYNAVTEYNYPPGWQPVLEKIDN